MILAEKIIRMRKKNGWSQEELAEKMNVSRQAVSKWESAQTIPDLEKILMLAGLFGVTTDFLLKDELENEAYAPSVLDAGERRITLEEANAYLDWRFAAGQWIAFGTFLCMVSALPLILLAALSEIPAYGIPENVAACVGVITLLLTVAVAVVIFMLVGFKNAPFEEIAQGRFEPEYGVVGYVKERQQSFRETYVRCNVIGVFLCVVGPVALLTGAFFGSDLLLCVLLCLTIVIVAVAVVLFITAGVPWAGMQRLLRQGEFSPQEQKNGRRKAVSSVYWSVATAVYLGWSFWTRDWHITWMVWPVAGVLFPAVVSLFGRKEEES